MLRRAQRHRALAAAGLLAVATACSAPSAPATGTNNVDHEGHPMEATIPGVSRPTVQQEVVDYLEKTVNALPPGTYLDGTAMPVGGRTAGCPDADPAKPTVRFEISMTVMTSPAMRSDAIAAQAEALWRSWGVPITTIPGAARPGWTAEPRPGYRLQIAAGQPPTISVSSVCFPDDAVLRDLPFPAVISHSP